MCAQIHCSFILKQKCIKLSLLLLDSEGEADKKLKYLYQRELMKIRAI